MNKNLIFAVVGALLLVTILVTGKKAGWWGGDDDIAVVFTTVDKRDITETVSASGQIQSESEVIISPDVPGEIVELKLIEGDKVEVGQLLVKIDPDLQRTNVERLEAALNTSRANLANTESRLAQSQAQLVNAEASFNRSKQLFVDKVIPMSEYDAANASFIVAQNEVKAAKQSVEASKFNVKSAEAALKEAQKNLNRTEIYAPVSGTISKLNFEQGERVVGTSQMAGSEIMIIADLNEMEVIVDVNENDIIRVGLGDSCDIEVDAYLGKKFKGIVTSIANSATSNGLNTDQVTNFEVKVRVLKDSYKDLSNEKQPDLSPFRPGMSASVDIKTKKARDVVAVPIQCVTTREVDEESSEEGLEEGKEKPRRKSRRRKSTDPKGETKEVVFVKDGSSVTMVEVKTGIQDNLYIQIQDGLTGDEVVVKAPYSAVSKDLDEGSSVTEVEEEDLFKSEDSE